MLFGAYLLTLSASEWLGIRIVFSAGSSRLLEYLFRPANLAGWLLLCVAINRILGLSRLRRRVLIPIAGLALATDILLPETLVYIWPCLGLLIWRCALGARSSWSANWPVVLASGSFTAVELNTAFKPWLMIFPQAFSAGGLSLSYTSITQSLLGAVLLVRLLRRLSHDRREKMRMSSELEAAREIQQLLLAGDAQPSRNYSLEVVYLPAQELGGDLYYSLPCDDGGFTLVTGDVSGKGLRAALQVPLVVGAIRESRERQNPGRLLQALNRAVHGQTAGGFVTYCCAHFGLDGTMVIANAGHIAPFSAGRELQVEPGLPLGIVADVSYDESTIALLPGEALTFLSDGVIEAVNAKGELLGFECAAALSVKPAREIAEAAQACGQNDDITVVTVRRSG